MDPPNDPPNRPPGQEPPRRIKRSIKGVSGGLPGGVSGGLKQASGRLKQAIYELPPIENCLQKGGKRGVWRPKRGYLLLERYPPKRVKS